MQNLLPRHHQFSKLPGTEIPNQSFANVCQSSKYKKIIIHCSRRSNQRKMWHKLIQLGNLSHSQQQLNKIRNFSLIMPFKLKYLIFKNYLRKKQFMFETLWPFLQQKLVVQQMFSSLKCWQRI